MTGKPLTGTVSAEEEAPGALAAECPRQSVKTELFSEPVPGVPLLGKFACWSIFFSLSVLNQDVEIILLRHY